MGELDFERSVHGAAQQGNFARLEAQLRRAGAASSLDAAGFTPLHYAARQGHLDACRLLLDAGADPGAQTPELRTTPLHRAVLAGHVNVCRLLLARGADPDAVDSDGRSPASIAAASGNDALREMLARAGRDSSRGSARS